MPKSKRTHARAATKVKPVGRQLKEKLVDKIQQSLDSYERCFVFEFQNMRSTPFKELRHQWADSRFFLGKNRVMALAFGDSENEYRANTGKLAQHINGMVGLLFTNRPASVVQDFLHKFGELDYARSGFVATETVVLEAGEVDMPHTMTQTLAKLGMPVKLEKGTIKLRSEYTICSEGDVLTPAQAKLLKLFAKPMAWFKLHPVALWESKTSEYTNLTV